jgi:protein-disulfide isomerase/uncharacterized membrane protein
MSDTPAQRAVRFWRLAAFTLVLVGMAASAYLVARHLALTGGRSQVFDICRAVFGGDCDAAITSALAVQLGIPLAGWGVVYFALVGVSLLLAYLLGESFVVEGTLAALALAALAAALGLVLTGIMLSPAAPFCPLCVVVHVVNLLLIPAIVLASGRTLGQLRSSLAMGCRYLRGARVENPLLVRWKVTGLLTAALAGVVAYQWILIQAERRVARPRSAPTFQQTLADFNAAQPDEISLTADDPRRGEQTAGLELVVFSDFQCPACQRFAGSIARVAKLHPQLAVIFKHYPLGKGCNPGVRIDLHPLSCGAAYAAEAARRQGRFWEYHDALFASAAPLAPDVLRRLAQEVGLDMTQFEADLVDPTTKAKVQADVALGKKLKLEGTPTAFLNHKVIPGGGMRYLAELVQHVSAESLADRPPPQPPR